ncbi:MAG: hypothetical protein LH632_16100 [Rhodoferax sp.]|nr:hypothetical protein [Rhodoferax sp.]
MLPNRRILVSVCVLVGNAVGLLSACGQKGALALPTEPAAAQRATLPQSLRPFPAPIPSPGASGARPAP